MPSRAVNLDWYHELVSKKEIVAGEEFFQGNLQTVILTCTLIDQFQVGESGYLIDRLKRDC